MRPRLELILVRVWRLRVKLRDDRDARAFEAVHARQDIDRLPEVDALTDEPRRLQLSRFDQREHRPVAMRLHAVTAADLEFVGDDQSHRHARRAVLGEHESDLYVTS